MVLEISLTFAAVSFKVERVRPSRAMPFAWA